MSYDDELVDQHSEAVEPQLAAGLPPIRTSREIDKLAEALAKAQGAMKHPQKNKQVMMDLKTGGKVKYSYADLADQIDAYRVPFAENGLSMVQIPYVTEDRNLAVLTRLMHASGQWIDAPLEMHLANGLPQTIGSAITYARRYSGAGFAGLAAEDDDDGNIAQGQPAQTAQRRQDQRPQQTSKPSGPPPASEEMTEATKEFEAACKQARLAGGDPPRILGSDFRFASATAAQLLNASDILHDWIRRQPK